MSILAIIPARGGSKRIPKKNIRPFCGKPVIAYSIEAARISGLFDEVMVSTDSEEIALVAGEYGAAVPFMRSDQASDDFATTADVVKEVLDAYKERGRVFDAFCVLYATAPFIEAALLRDAYRQMTKRQADAVLSVARFSYPPQRAFLTSDDGRLSYWFPEHERTRSQDLTPLYHDAGQFYFVRTDVFAARHSLIGARTYPVILDERYVQDIDTESDWLAAEEKYLRLQREDA